MLSGLSPFCLLKTEDNLSRTWKVVDAQPAPSSVTMLCSTAASVSPRASGGTQDSLDVICVQKILGDPCWKCYKINVMVVLIMIMLEQDS